jgi:hypothetical protein
MAWIANVVDGQIILASWGNPIRDRVTHTFATTTERDTAVPTPTDGMRCYVTGVGFQVAAGAKWYTEQPAGAVGVVAPAVNLDGGAAGTFPGAAGATALRVMGGSAVVTTSGADAGINFTPNFPVSCLACSLVNGDISSTPHFTFSIFSLDKTRVVFRVFSAAGAAVGNATTCRVSWIAFGW